MTRPALLLLLLLLSVLRPDAALARAGDARADRMRPDCLAPPARPACTADSCRCTCARTPLSLGADLFAPLQARAAACYRPARSALGRAGMQQTG